MRLVVLLGLIVAVTSCSAPAAAPTLNQVDYSLTGRSYGVSGSITQTEFQFLKTLAWPQAYQDMIGSFGFPAHRTATEDYYLLEGTHQWVVIDYQGKEATGFHMEG